MSQVYKARHGWRVGHLKPRRVIGGARGYPISRASTGGPLRSVMIAALGALAVIDGLLFALIGLR